jgi:hypothetical protein
MLRGRTAGTSTSTFWWERCAYCAVEVTQHLFPILYSVMLV